jgi:flagellar basal-body rod protein FlgB
VALLSIARSIAREGYRPVSGAVNRSFAAPVEGKRMDPSRTDPIALAEARLRWLDRRQQVLARNIANADTPGFTPSDLTPFAQHLARAGSVVLAATSPRHIRADPSVATSRPDRRLAEAAPNGNAVSLEEQAVRVAETDTAHALATALRRRFMDMFRTALGRQG